MKKLVINYSEYKGLVNNICRQIANSNWRPDYIVGITRGGLMPAVMISHYLSIPMKALDVSLRDGGDLVSNLYMAEDAFMKKNILIVDDINDSGATFNWIMNDWQSTHTPGSTLWKDTIWNNTVKFAVVVDNISSNCMANMDFSGMEINKSENEVWVDFPYESWWTIN